MPVVRDARGRFVSSGGAGNGGLALGAKVTVQTNEARVIAATEKAAFNNLGHAAASLSKDAKASIFRSDAPSPAGDPPHTRRGLLRLAIRYFVDRAKQVAWIGPLFSKVGTSASAHEFGGSYKGEEYPARPFMAPALQRAAPRFAGQWTGSIGE